MGLAGKRVLLVEDEMLIALDTVDELKNAGCTVIGPALRLEAALALAKSEELDAAILDINLMGFYVWPVAEALARRNIPFIFLTGFGVGLDFPPAFAAVRRLEKPVMPGAAVSAIEALFPEEQK
jgi:DNA-binding response OmpR family regulator